MIVKSFGPEDIPFARLPSIICKNSLNHKLPVPTNYHK